MPDKNEIVKCSKKNKTVCKAMNTHSSTQYGRGRRIFLASTINVVTNKEGIGAAYQVTGRSKDFVWLNFCPWCGGKWYEERSKSE